MPTVNTYAVRRTAEQIDAEMYLGESCAFGWGVTPVAAASRVTFTQTYSTTSATVAAATTHALTDNSAGTPSTTAIAALADGTTYATDVAAIRNNFATLAAEHALVRADILAVAKNVNSIIDALQAVGIAL